MHFVKIVIKKTWKFSSLLDNFAISDKNCINSSTADVLLALTLFGLAGGQNVSPAGFFFLNISKTVQPIFTKLYDF